MNIKHDTKGVNDFDILFVCNEKYCCGASKDVL